ncbi:MAG: M48 family metalloprotease [Cytophagales bacterium]|nr:M48 family metalloprotease [Armatimonadota bacterium]
MMSLPRLPRPLITAAAAASLGTVLAGSPMATVWAQTPAQTTADSSRPAKKDKDKKDKKPAEDSEVRMGREAHEDMLRSGLKLVRDPKTQERVEAIGKKIAEYVNTHPIEAGYGAINSTPYEYHFYVIDDPDINAFSLPGGYIYVNKGLLNFVQSDDELAGVLGHEVIHAAHHHVARLQREQNRINTTMALGVLAAVLARVPTTDMANAMTGIQLVALQKVNGFGQSAERDADKAGVLAMEKSGYNPVGMLTFMERLARDERSRPDVEQGIFRTHPPSQARAKAITDEIKGMGRTINRREVTNELKVAVRKVAVTRDAAGNPADLVASEVTLDGKSIFRTLSSDRAKAAADALDALLDDDLQLYDVTQRGNVVMGKGKPILTATPEDAVVPGNPNLPDLVATQAYKTLRVALFKQMLQSGN